MARKRMERSNAKTTKEVVVKLQETKALINRVQEASAEPNMTAKEASSVKYTRRGLVSVNNIEYYFSANRFGLPVVFGATNIEAMVELSKALDNKMAEHNKGSYFKNQVTMESLKSNKNIYLDEIKGGILIVKEGDKYFGYMPGKAGYRAVCYRKGGKPYSCSVNSLVKDLDRPGKMSFRQMASQGKDINDMIEKFMEIVAILDNRQETEPTPPRKTRVRKDASTTSMNFSSSDKKEEDIEIDLKDKEDNTKINTKDNKKETPTRRKRVRRNIDVEMEV